MLAKSCSKCGEEKPLDAYHKNRRSADGRRYDCKECVQRAHVARRERQGEEGLQRRRPRKAAYNRLVNYGLTPAEYTRMLEEQNLCCASCGDELSLDQRRQVHVDHCHDTGRVRGVLCRTCNLALGYLRDDPVRVQALLRYITP